MPNYSPLNTVGVRWGLFTLQTHLESRCLLNCFFTSWHSWNLGLPAAVGLTGQQAPRIRLSLAHSVGLWERSILPVFHMRAADVSWGLHLSHWPSPQPDLTLWTVYDCTCDLKPLTALDLIGLKFFTNFIILIFLFLEKIGSCPAWPQTPDPPASASEDYALHVHSLLTVS